MSSRALAVAPPRLHLTPPSASAGTLPAPVDHRLRADRQRARGSTAAVQITLRDRTATHRVAGTQNDLEFDPHGVLASPPTDCVINPAIGPGTRDRQAAVAPTCCGDPPRGPQHRLSLRDVNPMPSGVLYTCTFGVAADAALGDYTLRNTHHRRQRSGRHALPVEGRTAHRGDRGDADPDADRLLRPTTRTARRARSASTTTASRRRRARRRSASATTTRTAPRVRSASTTAASPRRRRRSASATTTRIAPTGQVCVDNRCVTPTPTPTPIGFCTSNDDCPPGQVCVDNMCVTVTPTAKKSGGGGCSCEIDPRSAARARRDVLAMLLPALLLALRWRRAPAG